MDIIALIGTFLGVGLVLAGMIMENGGDPRSIMDIVQVTAAFIVIGGTAGAVVLSFPGDILLGALKQLKTVYFMSPPKLEPLIREIVEYSQKARKEGVIALEKLAKHASDPLLELGLGAVADGADPSLVRSMLETQVAQEEAWVAATAKVWESFGGYSPTLGIVGAVLGLILVMKNLNDPAALGAGIAVAFVATVYGLFAANLWAIPFSSRIKFKYQKVFVAKELIIEGILAIQAGESPALIDRKLSTYIINNTKAQKA